MKAIKYFINIIKKLDYILTKKQKKQSIGILFLLIISSLLEMLSVSAIIPVLYAISEPEKLLENHLVQTISNILGISFSSTQHLFLFICITVAIVYIFRGGLLIISHYITLSFENRLMKNVSLLILSSYLKRPYIEMTNINSAEAYRNIGNGSTSVYYEVQCLFLLVNNFLMIAVLVIFLISVDPIMALEILGGFLVIGSIILFAMKRPVKKSGIEFNDSCFLVGKNALEALNGIKEITILNRNDYFVDKYEEAVELKRKAELNFRFFQRFPNTLIETILIIILVVIVSFQSVSGTDSVQLISKLAAIGLAGLRVLPNVSGITSNSASMIFYAANFNEAYENIKEARDYVQQRELSIKVEENISEPLNFNKIKINNLSWKYPSADHYTLNNISFEIKKGESIGFIGKSGAGKSTLADIILGVLNPEIHNAVTADDIDIFEIPKRWAKTVGYVPQSNFLLDDSIRNNILFGSKPEEDDAKIWAALEKAQLKDFVESLPEKLDTIVGERGVKFSGGQRQRISIARALYINPNLLVLDEATSALDNETEEAFMKSIEYLQGKITLIIIAHRLSTIEKCDKVFEIKDCTISEKQKVINDR